MAAWGTVWTKEVKENLRDWRAILPALIIGPVLSPVLMGTLMSTVLSEATERAQENLTLPVIGAEYAPNLIAFLRAHRVTVESLPGEAAAHDDGAPANDGTTAPPRNRDLGARDRIAAATAVRDRKAEVVLIVTPTIATAMMDGRPATLELVMDEGRRSSAIDARRANALLQAYGRQLGNLRLFARGIDPRIATPFSIDQVDVSTPSGRSVAILGILTYLVLFALLMGGLPITNDSTAGERERRSLEPLLTTPIHRGQLVLEKIFAAAFFMVVAMALCLTVLAVGLDFLPLERLDMRNNFGPRQALYAFGILLPFVLLGAGMMSIVASFTKTYKEAQTYLGFLVLIPTLPIVFAGIADLEPDLPLMFVPSLSQHFLLLALLKAEPIPAMHVAISAASTLAFALIAIAVAVKLYQREGLLG